MHTAFLAERTTRDLTRRLGPLAVNRQAAQDMANLGQALMIGNCNLDRTIKKVARAIRNLQPRQCVVACHSYELADQIVEECQTVGAKALLLWGKDKLPSNVGTVAAIATVPENLYRIRPAVVSKVFDPTLLFLFDPNGATFRGRSAEEGGGNRAGNISLFRAACLATGCQMLAVVCVSCAPAAFGSDAMCCALGVEALVYADGGTLRTELRVDFVAGDGVGVEQTLVDAPAVSPLDEPVTIARQAKARVLLYVTSRASAGAALLTELATLRGYPVLQLRSVCNKRDRQLVLSSFVDRGVLAGVADELTRQVTLMNKQVVVLADVQDFYEHFGLRNALFVIGSMTAPSLLALPGPDGLSGKDIRDLCYEIQRVQPKYHAPSLYEPGIG